MVQEPDGEPDLIIEPGGAGSIRPRGMGPITPPPIRRPGNPNVRTAFYFLGAFVLLAGASVMVSYQRLQRVSKTAKAPTVVTPSPVAHVEEVVAPTAAPEKVDKLLKKFDTVAGKVLEEERELWETAPSERATEEPTAPSPKPTKATLSPEPRPAKLPVAPKTERPSPPADAGLPALRVAFAPGVTYRARWSWGTNAGEVLVSVISSTPDGFRARMILTTNPQVTRDLVGSINAGSSRSIVSLSAVPGTGASRQGSLNPFQRDPSMRWFYRDNDYRIQLQGAGTEFAGTSGGGVSWRLQKSQ